MGLIRNSFNAESAETQRAQSKFDNAPKHFLVCLSPRSLRLCALCVESGWVFLPCKSLPE